MDHVLTWHQVGPAMILFFTDMSVTPLVVACSMRLLA